MLIYIHGFNSSSRSSKGQQLRKYFQSIGQAADLVCPDLPHRPAAAMTLLESLISGQDPETIKLVGSSLGGWYATVLAERLGVRAALVNPAVRPHLTLVAALGEQTNFSTGERYLFTETHLQELAALDLSQIQHPERLLVLLETGDEVLDYRVAQAYYGACRQVIVPGGDHGFRSFAEHIPEIMRF